MTFTSDDCVFYHQIKIIIILKKKKKKTPIGYCCNQRLIYRFFILPFKILPVELIRTHILLVLHCKWLCVGN